MTSCRNPWIGAALLASLAVPVQANATTYYISPNGNDSNVGTSPAVAWRTVARANALLRAGDVCMLLPGTYADAIVPSASGTPTARITYLGSLANPAAATVAAIDVKRAYVSVKGIKATLGVELGYSSETAAARYDSIAWCSFKGVAFAGAKYCMVARNTITGPVSFLLDRQLTLAPAKSNCEFDTLRQNVIDVGTITYKGFILRGYTQNCLVDSNRVSGMFSGTNGDVQGRYLYNSYDNVFRDNRWTFEALNAFSGGPWVAFALRDSSRRNLFERDTVLGGLASGQPISGRLVNAGNSAWTGQSIDNRWNQCYYKMTSYIWTQDGFKGATIENSVFASRDSWALWLLASTTGCTIRHNTFFSASTNAFRVEGDIRAGGNTISSNIFFTDSVKACNTGGGVIRHFYTAGFIQNNNLFYARTAPPGKSPSDQSLVWGGYSCSRPGSGLWNTVTGQDAASRFGSPAFVNSKFATLDPRITAGSAAIGIGLGGTNAGPNGMDDLGPDLTPPSAIATFAPLSVRDVSVVLSWIAPGDDGSTGTASVYDLRWSSQPITTDNFASATAPPSLPSPVLAGGLQNFVLVGLTPGSTVYCALRTRDEADNWSALSNVLAVTTPLADVVRPAAIGDLGAR